MKMFVHKKYTISYRQACGELFRNYVILLRYSINTAVHQRDLLKESDPENFFLRKMKTYLKNIRSFGSLSNALLKRQFHIVSYK